MNKNAFCKVFIEQEEKLEEVVTKWIDFMQQDGKSIEIVSSTQTRDENNFITLIIFVK